MGQNYIYLPAGLRTAQHAGSAFTQWFKNGRHTALINVNFGTGSRPLLPCQISRLLG